LTLLRRDESHEFIVTELGMNHRGEIAYLAEIAQPTVGLLTNAGTAHIEYLGSREAIAQEKGDLIAALPESAFAVVNADDAGIAAQAERTTARVVRFGTGADADVRAVDPTLSDDWGWKFELIADAGRIAVEVPGLGETTWRNALAAAAAALCAGASLDQVVTGLARHQPVHGRLVPVPLANGATLIDDTYNANPQSMEVALRLLAQLAERGRSFAVVGDMGELGETTRAAHRATGALVAELGIDFLFALGEQAEETVAAARSGGMTGDRTIVGRDDVAVAEQLWDSLRPGDFVLVKGSRSMRMERIVKLLASHDRNAAEGT
jgi:UDP-N-acetylmuramoyl-tripeptide--D-alanyl-D-alanine ligase